MAGKKRACSVPLQQLEEQIGQHGLGVRGPGGAQTLPDLPEAGDELRKAIAAECSRSGHKG